MALFKQSFARLLVLFAAHVKQDIVATFVPDADEGLHQKANKLGIVSLLAGAEGPLAFHPSVEPVTVPSHLGSMLHRQQEEPSTSGEAHNKHLKSDHANHGSRAASIPALFSEWKSGLHNNAISFDDTLSLDQDDVASVEQSRNVHWSAGAHHQRPTHQVANVSLLAGADGPLAFHSSFEPVTVRSLLGRKAHRQRQANKVVNVSLLSGAEGPLAFHSSYEPLTVSPLLGGKAQRQHQANKVGNVSLLAGAEGPLAFHSSVEPVAVHSLLGSKAHRQQDLSTAGSAHKNHLKSNHGDRQGRAASVPAFFSEWRSGFRDDAVSFDDILAQDQNYAASVKQRQSVLSSAGGHHQHQANEVANVSFLAGTDGPLAFHSSVEPVTVHALVGSKVHRQQELSTAGGAQKNLLKPDHGDRQSKAAFIPAFFSEWRSSSEDDAVSFNDIFAQEHNDDASVEQGQSVLSSARVRATKAANVSLLAGTEGPLAFHSSVEPVTVHSLLSSKARRQQEHSTAGSAQKNQLKPDHGDRQSRAASIPAFFSEWRSGLHDDAVSFDDILAQGHNNVAATATQSHASSVPLASHTLARAQPAHNPQFIATGTVAPLVHPRSGSPGLARSVLLPAFLSELKSGSEDHVASFDDILARDVEDAVSSKQDGTERSIAEGPVASLPDANPVSTFLPPRSPPDALLRTKSVLRQPIGPKSPRWFESDADGHDAGNDPAYSRSGRNLVQTDFDESSRFWPGHIPHGGMGREHGSGPQSRALTHSRFGLPPSPFTYIGFPGTSLHGGTRPAGMPSVVLMAMAFALATGA